MLLSVGQQERESSKWYGAVPSTPAALDEQANGGQTSSEPGAEARLLVLDGNDVRN